MANYQKYGWVLMNISHRTIVTNLTIGFMKKLARASLPAIGLYFLLPTPDGVILHPLFGSLLSHIFGISFKQGIIISIATYTTIGIVICLTASGKQIYKKLKTSPTKRYRIGKKATLTFEYSTSNDITHPCSP